MRARTLVVVTAPVDGLLGYALIARAARNAPRPRALRLLATSAGAVQVVRRDARTLEIRPQHGFLAREAERMVRSQRYPFRAGEVIPLSDLSVEVVEVTGEGRPLAARFHFARPLEDPNWLWMRWQGASLVAYRPPPMGTVEHLPGADLATVLAGG